MNTVKGRALLLLALALCPLPVAVAQTPTGAIAQVDAGAEVAAALYAASATQAAAQRASDAKIRAQRREIERLRAQVRAGDAQLQVALTAAEERYVAALAARDRAYAQEIAVFRAAVEDIAATPEGAAALGRFNAGDEIGALAILDDLRAARDAARQKRANIESAAEGRRIATLALEARAKSKLTTAQVIARFEEVIQLDPGVHWDWVELGRLYRDAGNLPDALRAAHMAADTAANVRDRSVALGEQANVQVAQGDLPAALDSYRASLRIGTGRYHHVGALQTPLAHDDPGLAKKGNPICSDE
jgi:tetratricopeptide (TPR) repeat protein